MGSAPMVDEKPESRRRTATFGPPVELPWHVSGGALEYADLPGPLARNLAEFRQREGREAGGGIVVATASEVVDRPGEALPEWTGTETFYLAFADVPTPALMRLPTVLRLHKPDRRLHVTHDPLALGRLVVARSRRLPREGIVDAYVVADELVLVLGDLTVRRFPRDRIPEAGDLPPPAFAAFELDEDGSRLRWSELDLDLGVSSLLQAVDPASLAEAEIERMAVEDTGEALRAMREERGLRQRDIPGLGQRQVRRLEKSTSRLTSGAARSYAEAFDLPVASFLEQLGSRLREAAEEARPP